MLLMMHELQMRATGIIFNVETSNFHTLFPIPQQLLIQIKTNMPKIDNWIGTLALNELQLNKLGSENHLSSINGTT